MIWNNPPKFIPEKPNTSRRITPEQLASSGSEHASQVALFAWAALNVGKYPALAYMFAIPNGGLRDVRTATNLKAEGVKSGVPDIFLPWPITPYSELTHYHGLFIEMKIEKYRNTKNGGCSEAQLDFINHITNSGYYCKVCYSWIEAKDTIVAYLEGKL